MPRIPPPLFGADPYLAYIGANYSGSNHDVTTLQATITIPNGSAVSLDYYYEVLSAFDSANSYDQIGVADNSGNGSTSWYGQWTLYWAALTADCGAQGAYDNAAYTLAPNTEYTFSMSISSGYVSFDLYYGATTSQLLRLYASPQQDTGGTYFEESTSVPCGGPSPQVYEEIHDTYGIAQPEYNFFFDNLSANGAHVTTWKAYNYCAISCQTDDPGLMAYSTTSGDEVSVWNQWFPTTLQSCQAGGGTCEYSEQRGDSITVTAEVTASPNCESMIGSQYCTGDAAPSMNKFPSALQNGGSQCPSIDPYCLCPTTGSWTCSIGPSGDPELGFQIRVQINVPSTVACGDYPIRFNVTMASANEGTGFPNLDWTSIQFLLYVTGCSGGGGCVASGTPILTIQGYRPVQDLQLGQTLVGYNLTTGKLQNVSLLDNNASSTNRLVDINHGFLEVTPTDQPILIKNESFVGWLRDPQNLTIGDWMLDPVNSSWIFVYSLSTVRGHAEVFSVVVSGPNTFIANGVLMDKKT